MSSKKKLVISLSVAAAVLVAAIIAIVAVFASAQQILQSNVKISYEVKDVQGSVAVSYTVEGETEVPVETWSFNAGDAKETHDTNTSAIVIELAGMEKDTVNFKYVFKNTGSKAMKLTPSIGATGYTITYAVGGGDHAAYPTSVVLGCVQTSGQANTLTIDVQIKVTDNAFALNAQEIVMAWDMSAAADTDITHEFNPAV